MTAEQPVELQHHEPHDAADAGRLNWLRAAVLGANDGVISVAGLVVGVAGAVAGTDHARSTLLVTGVAGLVAGALSMAAGEYVSVSTQRDGEKALLDKERWELENLPREELEELTQIYEGKGLRRELAEQVAAELTAHDALAAHAEVELGIDPDELTNPWHAAWASMASFTIGALLPVLTILLPSSVNVPVTFVAVAIMLAITGFASARMSDADPRRALLRNVGGGAIAMAVTYAIGHSLGVSV
ncbi:VIT family protein [Calidifontibacter sp. DB0510]|uniref:VIT family protein n=1 Tax=Metallococcus carri TaxID=1656884 RepID=A0A967B0D5_9MICO|nr:VIT family protein [Metallococcus carri]NHN55093.1 VIT family protein [Metallococcus carri]NOP36170.1 VIT family protein [Calidifontibacter sp. DB2511S]